MVASTVHVYVLLTTTLQVFDYCTVCSFIYCVACVLYVACDANLNKYIKGFFLIQNIDSISLFLIKK